MSRGYELRNKRLMKLYGVKEVSGGTFREGFFSGLRFFDSILIDYLKSKGLYIEFINYLAERRKEKSFKEAEE